VAIITPCLLSLKFDIPSRTTNCSYLYWALKFQCRSNCQLSELVITNTCITELQCIDTTLATYTYSAFPGVFERIYPFRPHDQYAQPQYTVDSKMPFLPNLAEFHYDGAISCQPKIMTAMLEQQLLVSQKDHQPDSGLKAEKLHLVNIRYGNKAWRLMDPNLQEFYRQVISLSSRGTILNLVWQF
jgi:hypothetical protein